MAAKEISVKKYVVRLSGEERERLETLIRKGKSPARRVLKARILLKADVSEAGKGWSDNRIIEALETSPSLVYRVRKHPSTTSRRQVKSWFGATPCRRATKLTVMPGSKVSSTIRTFSAAVQRRRR
jgi:hypothetical protein